MLKLGLRILIAILVSYFKIDPQKTVQFPPESFECLLEIRFHHVKHSLALIQVQVVEIANFSLKIHAVDLFHHLVCCMIGMLFWTNSGHDDSDLLVFYLFQEKFHIQFHFIFVFIKIVAYYLDVKHIIFHYNISYYILDTGKWLYLIILS